MSYQNWPRPRGSRDSPARRRGPRKGERAKGFTTIIVIVVIILIIIIVIIIIVCIYICISLSLYTYTYTYIYIYISTSLSLSIYIYIYICVCTCPAPFSDLLVTFCATTLFKLQTTSACAERYGTCSNSKAVLAQHVTSTKRLPLFRAGDIYIYRERDICYK